MFYSQLYLQVEKLIKPHLPHVISVLTSQAFEEDGSHLNYITLNIYVWHTHCKSQTLFPILENMSPALDYCCLYIKVSNVKGL